MNTISIKSHICDVIESQKKGSTFRDISTLFKKAESPHFLNNGIAVRYANKKPTKVVGIESRKFIIESTLAANLNAGFVLARKPRKSPSATVHHGYEKKYRIDIHNEAINSKSPVLIHDDLLAIGGSMLATYRLIEQFAPKKIYINPIIKIEAAKRR